MFYFGWRPTIISRTLALLLAFLMSTGCAGTWVPVTRSPEQALRIQPPQRVRITRLDESTLVLRDAVVRGDSLVGRPEVEGRTHGTHAVALADIQRLERWKGEDEDVSKEMTATFLFVAGALFLLFLTGDFVVRS